MSINLYKAGWQGSKIITVKLHSGCLQLLIALRQSEHKLPKLEKSASQCFCGSNLTFINSFNAKFSCFTSNPHQRSITVFWNINCSFREWAIFMLKVSFSQRLLQWTCSWNLKSSFVCPVTATEQPGSKGENLRPTPFINYIVPTLTSSRCFQNRKNWNVKELISSQNKGTHG